MKTLTLSGEVGGPDFSARLVTDALDGAGAVHVVIDSGGGCTVTSFSIYQLLIEHPGRITTEVFRAGSAAVLPVLAGQHRTIRGAGHFFLHRCWSATIGTAETLIEAAASMNEWDSAAADLYTQRTGLQLKHVVKLMEAETIIGAEQALELGFIHEILGEAQPLPDPAFSRQQTELGCLQFEESSRTPAMLKQCRQARPVARHHPGAAVVIDAALCQKPRSELGHEEETLESFVAAERREAGIRSGLVARLRRTLNQGGRIAWPLQVAWTCSSCGETNYGPPAKNRLATPCRTCGATSQKEISS